MNGNGTDPLDTNPLSSWIRPVFAGLAGIVGLILVAFAGFMALAQNNWTVAGAMIVISLGFVGYYFGIRTQDKSINTALSLGGAIASKITEFNGNGTLPKANGGQSTTAVDDVSAVEKEPEFDTWDGEPPVPFDAVKFESEVLRDTLGQYGEENPATLFYEALAKTEGIAAPWRFNNLQALKDCRRFILGLAEKAFTWKWGVPYDEAILHLNDGRGCTTCGDKAVGCTYPDIDFKARQLGMDYYVALRYYREALSKVTDLEG